MNAIAVFDPKSSLNKLGLQGYVKFHQCSKNKPVKVEIHLKGFKDQKKHGIHIHENGVLNLEKGCMSSGAHFNPDGYTHGSIYVPDKPRHAGDLINNIQPDKKGEVNIMYEDHIIEVFCGRYCIIGRTVVIHENEDDLGLGNNEESLKTGNAGGRVACSIIGIST